MLSEADVPLRPPVIESVAIATVGAISVATGAGDHALFLPTEKTGIGYARAPQGMPTVETLLPILMDAAARNALPLTRAVEVVTAAPARLFGLGHRKGRSRQARMRTV